MAASARPLSASLGPGKGRRKEQFCFPMLSSEEIVSCLAELGIHTTDEELSKGRPEVLHHVYESLLIECLDISKEELYTPKDDRFENEGKLEFGFLHSESVPVLHFFRAMYVGRRATVSPPRRARARLPGHPARFNPHEHA